MDGAITAVASPTSFVVGQTNVDASQARFINGQPTDVAVGREVHATGTRNGGALRASSVKFVNTGSQSAEVEGRVAAISAPGVFVVRSTTIDARTATIQGGTLSAVRVGTKIEATGSWQGTVLVAKRLALD